MLKRLWAPVLFLLIWYLSLRFIPYPLGLGIAIASMVSVGSSLLYVLVGTE